jgi:hypothetical protein
MVSEKYKCKKFLVILFCLTSVIHWPNSTAKFHENLTAYKIYDVN